MENMKMKAMVQELNDDELFGVNGGGVIPGSALYQCSKCKAEYTSNVQFCTKFVNGVKCGGLVVKK